MFAFAKVLLLAIAVAGVSATGVAMGAAQTPMTKAIEIHEDHLQSSPAMPDQAMDGQQNAYDHIVENQEKWLAKNHTWMPGDRGNKV